MRAQPSQTNGTWEGARRGGCGALRARAARLCVAALLAASACGCSFFATEERAGAEDLYEAALDALRRGELDRALQTAANGREALPSGAAPEAAARFDLLEAEVLLFRRETSGAAALLQARYPESAAFAPIRARQLQLVGQLEIVKGQLEASLRPLENASLTGRAAGAMDVAIDAETLHGQALLRLGRFPAAYDLLESAAAAAAARGDRYRQAVAWHNMGHGHLVRNRYDEALVFFERVLSLEDLVPFTVYATTLTNAALCYTRLGDTARAVDALERAIAAHERRGAQVYLEQALGELGSTYIVQGEFDRAVPPLERAFEEAREAGQATDAALWAANLASAYLEQQQWDAADRWNQEASRLGADARNAPYQALFEARILEGRGRTGAAAAYARAAALGTDDPRVQWRVAARLGWLAHTAGDRRAASTHFEHALDIVERTRADLLAPDHRLFIQQRTSQLYYEYVDVVLSHGEFERALSIADSGRARVLAERQGADAPSRRPPSAFTQAARRTGADVILFYWLGPTQSYAWVVTAGDIRLVRLPGSREEVGELVEAYRTSIVDALADPLASVGSPGARLYEMLVAPLENMIRHGARVIVIPDGPLGLLNFEALPVGGQQRRYWIQDVEIAVAPSLDALLTESVTPAEPQSLLLIGDASEIDPAYPTLRHAPTEMDAVAAAFPGRAVEHRRDRASPAAYRMADLPSFDVVHFTAHAEPNSASPLDSAIILSRAGDTYKLYAREIVERPLSADLVTISACRSAVGRTYYGEGLVGFAWAFLRAGARRVIAGLWDVDDRSTADLMARLYAHLAAGDTPSAALRKAKLSVLAEGGARAKPYYWAPFQVFVGAAVTP